MGYQNENIGRQKDELLAMLKKSSVSALFYGHLHNTNFYEKDNLKMYVAGSVNSSRNWQTPRFLEVKVLENGELAVKEIEL
jgi:predicted phosphodiesterase